MASITVGQALLVIIDKYQKDTLKPGPQENKDLPEFPQISLESLKKLYLIGPKDPKEHQLLDKLLASQANGVLKGFNISRKREDISEDPTRRYFETHLAYESLEPFNRKKKEEKDSEPSEQKEEKISAFKSKLKKHFDIAESYLTGWTLRDTREMLNSNLDTLGGAEKEFKDAIDKAKSPTYYKEFSLLQRETIILLLKSAFYALVINSDFETDYTGYELPLNIYGIGYFDPEARSRIQRAGLENTPSSNIGLLKNTMPRPQEDITSGFFSFAKPSERNTFSTGAWADHNFSKLVHPFSSSISGTLLLQLRLLLFLKEQDQLQFKTAEDIGMLIKYMASAMLYNSGGHSFYEYFALLEIPEIQNAFKFIPGFDKLSMTSLLYDDNKPAFDAALNKAIEYNNVILNKKNVHAEIQTFNKAKLKPAKNQAYFLAQELKEQHSYKNTRIDESHMIELLRSISRKEQKKQKLSRIEAEIITGKTVNNYSTEYWNNVKKQIQNDLNISKAKNFKYPSKEAEKYNELLVARHYVDEFIKKFLNKSPAKYAQKK